MGTLYGDSIFESTISLDTLIESFNNDLLLFDGLLNESVLNESLKEKAKELGKKLSVIIDKVIAKINEIRTKLKTTVTLTKWQVALARAKFPIRAKYVDAEKVLDFAEDINWHADNISKLADKFNLSKNEVEVERDNLENIEQDYRIKVNNGERANVFLKIVDVNDKEDAGKFLKGELKSNVEKCTKISMVLNKIISSLRKLKEKIGRMEDKSEKDLETDKSAAYSKLYGYSIETIGLMKKMVELCNYSLTPHLVE